MDDPLLHQPVLVDIEIDVRCRYVIPSATAFHSSSVLLLAANDMAD
jgi:hypothetical protein